MTRTLAIAFPFGLMIGAIFAGVQNNTLPEVAGLMGIAFGIFIAAILYFLPTLVAHKRSHPHLLAIFVLNLLMGVTVIGWVGSLVWGLVPVRKIELESVK